MAAIIHAIMTPMTIPISRILKHISTIACTIKSNIILRYTFFENIASIFNYFTLLMSLFFILYVYYIFTQLFHACKSPFNFFPRKY